MKFRIKILGFAILSCIVFTSSMQRSTVPGPPGRPTVTKVWSDKCEIEYVKPIDDGGARITNYVIEYMEIGSNKWVMKGTSRNLSYRVLDLVCGSKVSFRVSAENKHGIGKPSYPSDIVVIRDPFRP